VALFYYLMVAKRMYIDPPLKPHPIPVPPSLAATVIIGALAVVLLGVYPKPLLDAALSVSASLF